MPDQTITASSVEVGEELPSAADNKRSLAILYALILIYRDPSKAFVGSAEQVECEALLTQHLLDSLKLPQGPATRLRSIISDIMITTFASAYANASSDDAYVDLCSSIEEVLNMIHEIVESSAREPQNTA